MMSRKRKTSEMLEKGPPSTTVTFLKWGFHLPRHDLETFPHLSTLNHCRYLFDSNLLLDSRTPFRKPAECQSDLH